MKRFHISLLRHQFDKRIKNIRRLSFNPIDKTFSAVQMKSRSIPSSLLQEKEGKATVNVLKVSRFYCPDILDQVNIFSIYSYTDISQDKSASRIKNTMI